MEKSGSIEAIAKALHDFQEEATSVKRDGRNPFFRSQYATLDNVLETVRPLLAKHGLAVAQFPEGEDGLTTMLMHTSGQFVSANVTMHPKERNPQGQGSAITYMRRYALSAMLGLTTEEDDDGNAATSPKLPGGARKIK